VGCLLLLAFALYANTIANGFVYDDHDQLQQNPYVHSARFIGKVFGSTVWSFQGEQGATNYYRPLMTFGYFVCHLLFGSFPFGYHLVNIFVHLGVVCLVYAVSVRLYRAEAAALAAGVIFALHPIHTESVAWIAGITDLELTFFYLLAFLFFLRLEEPDTARRPWVQAGMLASFFLALLSKEQAMSLPVLATIYEHFFRADRQATPARQKFARYAGFWVLGAAYLLFRIFFLGGLSPVLQHPGVTWPQALLSALALVGNYLRMLFWPWPLSPFYPFHKSVSFAEPRVLAGAAALLAVLALLGLLWKRARPHAFALFWIFLTLAPVLNARWMAASVFAERYLYLPSVGFSWLLGAGLFAVWQRAGGEARRRRAGLAVAAAAVALLSSCAVIARNRDWHDDLRLFRRTLAVHPDAAYIRSTIGAIEWSRGNRAEAEALWLQALASKPDDAIALSDLGLARLEQKRYDEALAFLARATELRPRFAAPYIHRGRVYLALGRLAAAEVEFRRAAQISPLNPQTRNALGRFWLDAGRVREAEAEFRASVENFPTTDGFRGLAESLARDGQPDGAEHAWRELLALDPFDSEAHFRLGALLVVRGRLAEAEREYTAGLETDPNNADARAALQKLREKPASTSHP
jgi:tetratricopeptide (TPR) repeat protein